MTFGGVTPLHSVVSGKRKGDFLVPERRATCTFYRCGHLRPFHGLHQMTLEGITLHEITPLLISVQGQWSPGVNRKWRGLATPRSPSLLSLSFALQESVNGSNRKEANRQEK